MFQNLKFSHIIVLKHHFGFDILEFQSWRVFGECDTRGYKRFKRLFKLLDTHPAVKVTFRNAFRTMQFCTELPGINYTV